MAGETHPSRGGLFVVAGPSGVGKGTVIRRVLDIRPDIVLSVSATTRSPRPGETEGTDYRFVTDPDFDRLVADHAFLEWADIFGHHRSGTLAEPVERDRARGKPVILEIDVQGARQVQEREPDAVLIFLAPPSLDELERRLRARGTEDEAQLERRLAAAEREIGEAGSFGHVVVNEQVDQAAAEIARIIDEREGVPLRA